MKIKYLILIILLLAVTSISSNASDQIPAPPQSKPIALINCIIHPVSSPVIEKGIILFENGKIVALGTNVTIPSNAEKIDLKGKHAYPGMIESISRIGLTEVGSVRSTNDSNEMGSNKANVRAEVAVNPESEYFPVNRANGIALAVTQPTGGIISGKSALLKMDGWTWEEMTIKSPVSMIINWPQMDVINAWWMHKSPEEQRKNMKKQMDDLDKIFKDARAYMKATESKGKKGVPHHKFDARLEALIPCLKGELPVWITANSLKQIQAAVSWAKRSNLKMVLVGGIEACYAAELLKENNIPVIIKSILRLPTSRDAAFDEPFTLPLRMQKAGIKYCIASSGASNIRNLPYHAAKAASYGLPKEEALKAVTLYPAEIIGIADRAGSLEKGKDATIMITNGDPLEITTRIEKLFIEGRKIDLNNKHSNLYKKYKKRYQQMSRE